MRDFVYIVAVKRKDGKLPTSEKIVESRFFAEKGTAENVARYHNSLHKGQEPYQVFEAVLEIVNESCK